MLVHDEQGRVLVHEQSRFPLVRLHDLQRYQQFLFPKVLAVLLKALRGQRAGRFFRTNLRCLATLIQSACCCKSFAQASLNAHAPLVAQAIGADQTFANRFSLRFVLRCGQQLLAYLQGTLA